MNWREKADSIFTKFCDANSLLIMEHHDRRRWYVIYLLGEIRNAVIADSVIQTAKKLCGELEVARNDVDLYSA